MKKRLSDLTPEQRLHRRAYEHARYLARKAAGEYHVAADANCPAHVRVGETRSPEEIRADKAEAKAAHKAAKAEWAKSAATRKKAQRRAYLQTAAGKASNIRGVQAYRAKHPELSDAMWRRSETRQHLRAGEFISPTGIDYRRRLQELEERIALLRATS